MAETNSTNVQRSRYVAGGRTEVNSRALEWWERNTYVPDDTDTILVLEPRHEGRLDLIAHQYLGDSHLWWLIAQYNLVLDVYDEIVAGRVLRIPSRTRVQNMLTGKLGGYESTREVPLTNVVPIV